LLADRRPGVPGSAVVPAIEGSRPLLVEVQALVDDGDHANPRRSAQGIEARRLATVVAVLEQRLGLKLRGSDVFALAAGGVKVHEPAADLALAMALVSSRAGVAVPGDLVVCGEVGLGGEVRQVSHLARRLHEAARMGFRRALVPPSAPAAVDGIELLRAPTVAHAAALID
jgi:DNA repair protein RadA/Sms